MTALEEPARAAPRDAVLRHVRPRTGEPQETTTLELFFDLVYALAVTQLSQLLLSRLSLRSIGEAAFLLVVIWWAWIYTTWMVNWLDPGSPPVRLLVVLAALASLLMAAAVPAAFSRHALLFAGAYVLLQVGRNTGAMLLTRGRHALGDAFTRLTLWSIPTAVLWVAGALVPAASRMAMWGPALVLELIGPLVLYWLPGRGRLHDFGHPVEGAHFAERCQAFIIIVLGESIAVIGAEATSAGLTTSVDLALAVAFLETAALWWLYFGAVAEHSREMMRRSANPLVLARDAYTYLHLPIVAGVILTAVGAGELTAHPGRHLSLAPAAVILAGPMLFLVGELGFRLRMTHDTNPKRWTAVVVLGLLGLIATRVPAIVLGALVGVLLVALAGWEHGRSSGGPRPAGPRLSP